MTGGVLTFGLGLLLYGFEFVFVPLGAGGLPPINSFATPFVIAGIVMILVGAVVKEGGGPIVAPEGFRYCVFCSAIIPQEMNRCSNCGGLQPIQQNFPTAN
jgi:hypothetical protein